MAIVIKQVPITALMVGGCQTFPWHCLDGFTARFPKKKRHCFDTYPAQFSQRKCHAGGGRHWGRRWGCRTRAS